MEASHLLEEETSSAKRHVGRHGIIRHVIRQLVRQVIGG